MKTIQGFILGVVVLSAMPIVAAAVGRQETVLLRVEQRRESQGEPRITTVGMFGIGNGKMAHVDLTSIESNTAGNGAGIEIGVGYLIPTGVTLFTGVGVLLGYNSDSGEFIASYYPEVGIILQITKEFGISASHKRYYNLYNRMEVVTLFGLVFTRK